MRSYSPRWLRLVRPPWLKILLTDSSRADTQGDIYHGNPDIGKIQVKVWRIKSDWETTNRPPQKITVDESPIHESKKMLGGHRVK
jgi:hypothetical protein